MAKTISLTGVTQTFLEKTILNEVSFKCSPSEKFCIVGENGAGKSTLLKIISGTLEPTEGSIEYTGHIRCHYIPQEFNKEYFSVTVQEYIKDHAGMSLFKKIFDTGRILGFDLEKIQNKTCGSLSGGQQKILALSVGIAIQPDFLLLDEPENHLDIVSRLELMRILEEYKNGILFVSHDRLMIDAIADKVAEIVNHKIYISEGGYEDYVNAKLSRITGWQRSYDAETKRMKRIEGSLSILHQKAFRGKNVSQYKDRKQELEDLKTKHKQESRPDDKKTKVSLHQSNPGLHKGKLLCRIKDAHFAYDDEKGSIFKDLNLEMRYGSHIVLLGRNGSGKSTFLKCLMGLLPLSKGSVEWAEGVTRAYFDQHAEFEPDKTPLQIVTTHFASDEKKARSALGAMKFTPEKMTTAVKFLSGGERMRVRFALVFGAHPDVIIFDEPTNHLDEVTWEILLHACNISKSTILLVTHDFEFIEEFEKKVFWLINKRTIRERHKELGEIIEEIR